MTTMTGPCDWPISYSACSDLSAFGEPTEEVTIDELREPFERMAMDYLWNWTERKYGTCEVEYRPCRSDCGSVGRSSTYSGRGPHASNVGAWGPVLIDGQWFNVSCGQCGDGCSCDSAPSLQLPGPVAKVSSVQFGPDVLDPSEYVVRGSRIYLTSGQGWPTCQDLSKPLGEPDTWAITFTHGVEVPIGGQVAAGILALEFAKASCHDDSCQLPRRLQSLTRQGVSIAVLDTFDDIEAGHTGIWMIDSWVASVVKPLNRSRVYSPDLKR